MMNMMRSRHLQMSFCSTILAILAFFCFAWLPMQAATMQQSTTCQISVQTGWSPHRVQGTETLASLAARSGVTVEDLMRTNCLTSEVIEAGALVLTPKLGPAIPAATPTDVPMPTATVAPTAAPTLPPTLVPTATEPTIVILDEPTATPVQESATLTPTMVAATATPTTAAVVAGNSNGTPPTSSSPISKNGIIAISLLIMGVVSALFFALQPRRSRPAGGQPAAAPSSSGSAMGGMVANIVFLIGGFVIGALLFPMLRMPSFVELPTWLSASAAVGLIGLLAVKEIFLGALQWRGLNRLLNLGIAPLLMIFLLSVITRFADVIH